MNATLRKSLFATHVILSVGWLGAVVAYLAVAVTGLNTSDDGLARAAYRVLELLGWWIIVPSSLAALLTGLVQSLATGWGLTRHTWILAKLVLTVAATLVLLQHMRRVEQMAAIAANPALTLGDFQAERIQLVVHPLGGLVVLLAITVISVFKPWGLMPWARSSSSPQAVIASAAAQSLLPAFAANPKRIGQITLSTTIWRVCIAHVVIGVVALLLLLHLSGGMRHP